jgi:hypothetical protein
MIRRLPPLNALKAFEAAARHERSTLPKIKACRDWLLAEAADDARRLKEIGSSPKGVPKLKPSDNCCTMTQKSLAITNVLPAFGGLA